MPRIHELAGIYSALGDATRLRILGLLASGEVCVCHIHEALRLPQPTVSRHLAHLRRARLVHTRRDGTWVHYRLAPIEDPSARAALSAAIHAIGHAPATRSDRQRLEVSVPRPSRDPLPVEPCGAPECRVLVVEGHVADVPAVRTLLLGARLPIEGFEDGLPFVVARKDGMVVGSAALEEYSSGALLRSVAVAEGLRGSGIGQRLAGAAIDLAGRRGHRAIYLLTTTAADFFPRFGFSVIDRADVPAEVKQSVEFTSACPESAVVMRREDTRRT
jgi:amino-acid N-acetyltransferase